MLPPWSFHGSHGKDPHITTYIWCAIGAILGLLLGTVMGTSSKMNRLEEVAAGMFGAVAGGDMLVAWLMGPEAGKSFSMGAMSLSLVGAAVALTLLVLMRRAVGPQEPHKKRAGPK